VGIDPSAYSKRLCELIAKNFIDKEEDLNLNIDENFVKDLITKSVRENGEKGSSTVCVLYMANNTVHSGYLGDSCFLIVRPKTIGSFELLFKSKEQTHGFNIPFQVGSEGDDPSCAVTANHIVQRDDVIILATDGLWDNMEVDTIIEELNNYSIFNKSVSIDTNDFAKKLSQKAEELSFKKDYKSPFARRAVEHNEKYKTYTGGKPDDITVIVAQISNTKNNLIINDTVPH
jgi:protein phosphatase PTC7